MSHGVEYPVYIAWIKAGLANATITEKSPHSPLGWARRKHREIIRHKQITEKRNQL